MRLPKEEGAVLAEALVVLERDGWCSFSDGTPGSPRCIMGAIDSIVGGGVQREHLPRLVQVITERSGHVAIFIWNDAKGRTFDEVREVMLAAIEKCAT